MFEVGIENEDTLEFLNNDLRESTEDLLIRLEDALESGDMSEEEVALYLYDLHHAH